MSFSRGELEFLSIYYYLKEGIIAREFSQEVQNDPLVNDTNLSNGSVRLDYLIVDPVNSSFKTKPVEDGRGWLSFDNNKVNPCQIYNPNTSGFVNTYNTPFDNQSYSIPTVRESNTVKVKDQNHNLLDRSWYELDYNKGRVRFPCPTTPSGVITSGIVPSFIDYKFHYVSVKDGWPDSENIPEVPFISVYPISEVMTGYQMGPGVLFERKYRIDVFAESSSNRKKLLDIINTGLQLKHAPVIDFNRSGLPLTQWGTINKNFIQTLDFNGQEYQTYLTLNHNNGNILYFLNNEVIFNSTSRSTRTISMLFMGSITFTTRSYSDKDPDLVGKFAGLSEPVGGFDSLILKAYNS